jgi:SAM-dependent methyltransferase
MNDTLITNIAERYKKYYDRVYTSLNPIEAATVIRYTEPPIYYTLISINSYLANYLKNEDINSVLDIGAGTGITKLVLTKKGFCVDSVEIYNDILYEEIRNAFSAPCDYRMQKYNRTHWHINVPPNIYDCVILVRFLWPELTTDDFDKIKATLATYSKKLVIVNSSDNTQIKNYISKLSYKEEFFNGFIYSFIQNT